MNIEAGQGLPVYPKNVSVIIDDVFIPTVSICLFSTLCQFIDPDVEFTKWKYILQ